MAVEAASAETIAGDKWRSGAYGRGWIWSKAHSATPTAEGSHRSPHAKSRNRSAAANGGLHALAVSDAVHEGTENEDIRGSLWVCYSFWMVGCPQHSSIFDVMRSIGTYRYIASLRASTNDDR